MSLSEMTSLFSDNAVIIFSVSICGAASREVEKLRPVSVALNIFKYMFLSEINGKLEVKSSLNEHRHEKTSLRGFQLG